MTNELQTPSSAETPSVPAMWSRTTSYLVVLAALATALWIILAARQLFGAILISALLAYILNPAVVGLRKITPLNRDWAVGIVYLIFISTLFALPAIATPTIARQTTNLRYYVEQIPGQLERLTSEPIEFAGQSFTIPYHPDDLVQSATTFATNSAVSAIEIIAGVSTNVAWILIALITTFYLLRDGPRVRLWAISIFPTEVRDDVKMLIDQIDLVWGRFLRGQTMLAALIGVLTGVLTAAVGLPGALIIGIIAGVLDLVPSLGPTVAGVIATVIAYFAGSTILPISNFWFAIVVASIIIFIQNIENIWLRPQILGYTLNLHPALVIVGVFGALATFGILGALVIVPVMASLAVLWRYAHPRIVGFDTATETQTRPIIAKIEETAPLLPSRKSKSNS